MTIVLIIQIAGIVLFVLGTLALGLWLRRSPHPATAVKVAPISHGLFCGVLLLPQGVAFFYPGLGNYDAVVGVPKLPFGALMFLLGVAGLITGIYYLVVAGNQLVKEGKGAIFFRLTQRLVHQSLYQQLRHPMLFGYCLLSLGAALAAGSTVATLGTLLLLIPALCFHLSYVEEMEMGLRFAAQYEKYRQQTPFFFPRLSWGAKKALPRR